MSYDPLYVEFIHYFNVERDYFECHEVLEELWLGEGRSPLYQGLLQVAVGLHHYSYGNASGALKLFIAGLEKLNSYEEHQLGINLEQYIADAAEYIDKLLRLDQEPFEFYSFDILVEDPELIHLVEELRLNPPVPHDESED